MPIDSYALTTLARFKTFIGLTSAADDTLLTTLINVVSDYVERFCDRRFKQTTYTQEIYDGTGSQQLLLRNYPTDETTGVTIDERASDNNDTSWNQLNSTLYHVDWNAGLIELVGARFAEVPRKYRITHKSGYNFDNSAGTPDMETAGLGDLEYAVWVLVNNMYQKRKNVSGIQSESIGNYSVTYKDYSNLDPEIKAILLKYRRPHLM